MILRWWRREQLPCTEVAQLLQSFLDGELDDLASRQVARHLDDCRRCGIAAETYEEIKRALRRSAGPPPADTVQRLRAFGQRLAEGFLPPDEFQRPADA